jgi:quercetin dioxygenase-like cupin family protein
MKPVYLVCGLLLFSLRAQAPTPVPLARGNTPGEPHHHLKIENEYVRAYYVEVPPRGETQLHQHDNDYMFVTLGDSGVTNAVLGKPEVHLQLKDGEVRFTRGGFAHVARNNSDAPFRNVTIEFLRPQGEARNHCEKIVEGPLGECRPTQNRFMSGMSLFETGELVVGLYSLNPKAKFDLVSRYDGLVVALEQAQLEVAFPGKHPVQLRSGEIFWLRAASRHTLKNFAAAPSRYLLLLFTDTASSPPKQ